MGIITDYLRSLIKKQVDEHGLVIWYDSERQYAAISGRLEIPNTTVAHYEGSFFALRHQINALMQGTDPPRLIVYVPVAQANTHNALIELETAGVVMQPGQQPPSRNTRLSIVARNALKAIIGEETIGSIEQQVEAGKLTLIDLENWSDNGGITKGVVSVIFGTGNPQDVALSFLSNDKLDRELSKRDAISELALLLQNTFEVDLPAKESAKTLRSRLARHILSTDFICGLQGEIPSQLNSIQIPTKPSAREACIALAKTWRLRRDGGKSYINQAKQVAQELGLTGIKLEPETTGKTVVGRVREAPFMPAAYVLLAELETFLSVEITLQTSVEISLLEKPTVELVDIAQSRQSRFWSEQLPDIQAHWALIAVAGQLLLEAQRIEQSLKTLPKGAKALFSAYTETEQPWCMLDTYHRHMERRWHDFDPSLHHCHDSLEKLINRARKRYMDIGSQSAETFVRQYQKAKFRIPGVLRQTEVFEQQLKPNLAKGKTAYVWVDALRYEMARELAQILEEDYTLEIQGAIATVPTITEIGMAALLPGAHTSATVVPVGASKLGLNINGTILKDRAGRVKFLQDNAGKPIFEAKLDDLLPSPKKKIRDGIQNADLILITSQEIDAIGEGDNIRFARMTMDNILHELRRGFRVLSDLGVEVILFVADHGYLFGEELGDDMKIDAPGGETADLHRRVWIGRGGHANPSYMRANLSDFGLGGDLEIATPWNFACFKAAGGTEAYFHGGLSPQELIIPVVTLIPKHQATVGLTSDVQWTLVPGSQKVSTRFFSVQVKGTATSLFELLPPKVRVDVRSKKETISKPISASYGFENATGDVQLKLTADNSKTIEPNTVTLMITEDLAHTTVTIHLLDATTEVELARPIKIEIAIAI
jgi:PglZ domain